MPEEMKEEAMAALDLDVQKRVTPAESFYGYVNQDYFASFDSGVEGAYVEPVYGELICPDPETEYEYSGDLQMQQALDQAAAAVKEKLFAGELETQPGSPGQKILDLIGDDPDAQRQALEAWAGTYAFRYISSRAMLELKEEFDMFTPHPTGAQQINGIISVLDCFYELYDVKEGDPMHTAGRNG